MKIRFTTPALIVALGLLATGPFAVNAATKKPAHKAAPVKKAEQATPATPEVLNDAQLAEAQRVYVGKAECELKQQVDVEPVDGQPGHFTLHFGKQTYHMIPEETTTGAVRLHDKKAEIVWIQIPAKSMLLDEKAGHRLVDGCQAQQQRTASL